MNSKTKIVLLSLIAADFLALTIWVLVTYGFAGAMALALAGPAGTLLAVDAAIALGLAAAWIWFDGRANGLPRAPYLLLTATAGSFGLLAYLIARELAVMRGRSMKHVEPPASVAMWAAAALAGFTALTIYVVATVGYIGFFEAMLANSAAAAGFVDLCLALTLGLVWMVADAKRRGVSPWPATALTLTFGSAGPLLFLARRRGV